jgi:circadian clock protein KaiC
VGAPEGSDLQQVEKVPTGVIGFDDIAHGGLPRGRTTLLIGGPGTGKTVFALETLVNGARHGAEPGIFVAFEEMSAQLRANAAGFGWDLPRLEKEKRLYVLDARMPAEAVRSGAFDLRGILASLEAKATQMGARRIVFDGIDVLLTTLDNALAEREEVYRIHEWLQRTGLTGIVTASAEGEMPMARYAFMQYMADCVIQLQNRVTDRVALRELRIVKYRGSAFEQNEFPVVIGSQGIEVAAVGALEETYPVFTDKVSSGMERLDTMLGGGYYRGSSIIITGSAGTAKTTLAALFVEAACRRGERALYVAFDEAGAEIVRNIRSIGVDLGAHIDSGLLFIHSARSEARSAEEHLLALKRLMETQRPTCMVIDPLSAMVKAGGRLAALAVAQRLIQLAKAHGITLLATSLLESSDPRVEASQIRISTIADSWIHLTFVVQGGERNRALSIVKSRGSKHSHQVRELVLSEKGVTLEPVYVAGGDVVMGTLRYEKESKEAIAKERARAEIEQKRRELELAETELRARIAALEREISARRTEIEVLNQEERVREHGLDERREEILRRRGADREE